MSSNGLEAALQCGHVLPTAASLSRFLLQNLLNLASSTFPYMRALYNFCHSSYNNSNHNTALDLLSALARLDSDYDAVISMNHVARRASQAQGVALLTLLSKDIFQISLEHREVCLKFKQLVRVRRYIRSLHNYHFHHSSSTFCLIPAEGGLCRSLSDLFHPLMPNCQKYPSWHYFFQQQYFTTRYIDHPSQDAQTLSLPQHPRHHLFGCEAQHCRAVRGSIYTRQEPGGCG